MPLDYICSYILIAIYKISLNDKEWNNYNVASIMINESYVTQRIYMLVPKIHLCLFMSSVVICD